jgi:hypothetical protein
MAESEIEVFIFPIFPIFTLAQIEFEAFTSRDYGVSIRRAHSKRCGTKHSIVKDLRGDSINRGNQRELKTHRHNYRVEVESPIRS